MIFRKYSEITTLCLTRLKFINKDRDTYVSTGLCKFMFMSLCVRVCVCACRCVCVCVCCF